LKSHLYLFDTLSVKIKRVLKEVCTINAMITVYTLITFKQKLHNSLWVKFVVL